MISLKSKNRLTTTAPDVLTNTGCATALRNLIADPLKFKVRGYYNDPTVKEKLKIYHGAKCVYCETDTSAGASYRVDHYRPKRFIKGVNSTTHYGYFWLAFEWTNLLQSCEACNGAKSNEFPLLDKASRIQHLIAVDPADVVLTYRHLSTSLLNGEKRLLLHPELDEVEKYLVFNHDGSVVPIKSDKTVKGNEIEAIGKETIRICKLNRGNLVKARKKKIDKFYQDLVEILNDYEDRGASSSARKFLYSDLKKYFVRMLKEQQEDEPYSRVGFYMFDNFKEFYIDRLSKYGDIGLVEEYRENLVKRK